MAGTGTRQGVDEQARRLGGDRRRTNQPVSKEASHATRTALLREHRDRLRETCDQLAAAGGDTADLEARITRLELTLEGMDRHGPPDG